MDMLLDLQQVKIRVNWLELKHTWNVFFRLHNKNKEIQYTQASACVPFAEESNPTSYGCETSTRKHPLQAQASLKAPTHKRLLCTFEYRKHLKRFKLMAMVAMVGMPTHAVPT